jgi:branched-chain amino acid transport system substrate-binding protein
MGAVGIPSGTLVFGLCTALAVAVSVGPALAQRAEPCIGASWEMTGPLANTGAMLRITVETALDQINAAGGVLGKPLRLVIYDDVGEPARAVDNPAASEKVTTASS